MERQAKEDAIKRGLGSFGPQAAWLAGLMAPSSGITDTLGLYPADTSGSGEKLPSFGENIQNKQYLDALYQGLGLAGDLAYASTPFTGAVGILGGTALKGMGAVGKATKASKPIKAYHGSPHDFEKFDIGRMGSGEGFQAFGRGIYFAESEAVAKGYKKELGTVVKYDGKTIMNRDKGVGTTGDKDLDDLIMQYFGDMDKAIINAEEQIDVAEKYGSAEQFQWWRQNLAKLKEAKPKVKVKKTGKVYETDIYATPDELLDWDKPLSKQPKAVQEKLEELGSSPTLSRHLGSTDFLTEAEKTFNLGIEDLSGKKIYELLDDWFVADEAEKVLDEVGIKGIKYFDGFSRGKQSGTSNYVIFDTRILDIANKYGVAIPVAGAMLLSIDKGEKAIEGGRKDI